jgi:glucose-6-phosphate-specific signal transduction histidine kinase
MKKLYLTTLYAMLWICYLVFNLIAFPRLRLSASIPVVALVGLGTWIYGRTIGLALIIPSILFHIFLTSILFADVLVFYQFKLTSYLLFIILVYLVGTFRHNHVRLIELNHELDQLVLSRNRELGRLADQLLDKVENQRIGYGQNLHDGIGQQLTGIQLYSTTLGTDLANANLTSASLAFSLSERARTVHNLIRRISRSLFPVQINEVGLRPALEELKAYLGETSAVNFSITYIGDTRLIPKEVAHQLFRICQETVLYILKQSNPESIMIECNVFDTVYHLSITQDGASVREQINASPQSRLVEYRVMQIAGELRIRSENRNEVLLVSVPREPEN